MSMTEPRSRVLYQFDRFQLDPHVRLLLAEGASGAVPLPPRVFDTLLYFVQRPGQLLSKGELIRAIWPRVVVEENSLNQHVSMLRRVLGETPGEHRFIVTVPGHGYRFVADVQTVPATTAGAPRSPTQSVGREAPQAAQQTRDLDAYHLYMQAIALSLRTTAENAQGAIGLLHEALKRDPQFARAASLLALQYTTCVIFDFPVPGALACAEREAERALRLDPSDGSTHGAVGVVEAIRGNWLGSATHFRTSRALGSDVFTSGAECAYLTHSVGHIRQAALDAEQTFRSAPLQPMAARMLALTYLCQGRDAEALHHANLAVQLGQARTVAPLSEMYALLALRQRRFAEAAGQFVSGLPEWLRSAGAADAIRLFCSALEDDAHRESAIAALDALEMRVTLKDLGQPMHKRLLLWRAMLGDLDSAYAHLDRCLDHYALSGTVGSAWGFLWLPEMTAFRRDFRFQRFVTRIRLVDYWREYGAPDGCELREGRLLCA